MVFIIFYSSIITIIIIIVNIWLDRFDGPGLVDKSIGGATLIEEQRGCLGAQQPE